MKIGIYKDVIAVIWLLMLAPALDVEAGSERVKRRDSAIEFTQDLETAVERAQKDDKSIVLIFAAAWCPVCRHLDEVTLLEPSMQAVADDFIWLKIDIDRRVSLAEEWGVEATPTTFILDSSGRQVRTFVGGADAGTFSGILHDYLNRQTDQVDTGKANAFEHIALIHKPGGFRGKSICFSHVGYGPIGLRSQSVFQSLRLGIVPRAPSTLARGQHQLRLGGTWANFWANDDANFDPSTGEYGAYLLDYETFDASFVYAYGLSDTFQIDVEYEERRRFGGAMDGLIQSFHDLFGINQSGRDLVPQNQFQFFIDPENGAPPIVLNEDDRGTFARNLLFSIQHNVTCGTATLPALSWAMTGRYSLTDTGELEGSSLDVALSAAASRRIGKFYVYLTLGYAYYGSDAFLGIELEQTQFTALTAVEWRFNPRMSLVLQYLVTDGAAKDLGPFSETANEVVLGWKWELRTTGVLELGLLENTITFDNSPDFGFHVAFTQRF